MYFLSKCGNTQCCKCTDWTLTAAEEEQVKKREKTFNSVAIHTI